MDGLDFHPYPIPQSLPFATGYAGTTSASVSNLPRIYQAFYDGFNGSPQPTIGQQAGGGLPLSLNEVGIQTDSTGRAGYVGTETAGERGRRRARRDSDRGLPVVVVPADAPARRLRPQRPRRSTSTT